MKRKKLRYHYDREADVMYFDRPRRAKTVELAGDFILRLDPATKEVVGMTVISFSRHFSFLRGRVPDDGEVETNEVVKALLAA